MSSDKTIYLPEEISVRSLAGLLKVDPTSVIAKLIAGGVMATINQSLDYETAALIAEEFGLKGEKEAKPTVAKAEITSRNAVARPPIVTIMGHVDHGKTTLLDYIRHSNIASSESGGITQHISAYQINFALPNGDKRPITFIDTPGHEAFSAIRAHGAALTDVVILVVAADDGVKPQTLEALKFAQGANVPVVVAINKSDLPSANPERIKQQLSDAGLVPEEWGGKTTMLPISAKTGQGVDQLLELVLLTADLLELRADPDVSPEAVVIEANLDKQTGPIATLLIYNGTLKMGQVIVVGKTFGRVRAMTNDRDVKISAGLPAMPVQIQGLKDVPKFGDRLVVVPSEKVARSMTQTTSTQNRTGQGEDANTFKILIKADVGGSLAALEDSIGKLSYKDARIEIVSTGIGQVTENDITFAKAAGALVIVFRSAVPKRITELAEKEGVTVREFWIIYEIIELLQSELKQIALPVFIKTEIGRLKVLAIFSRKGKQAIVGGEVSEGEITAGTDITIFRNKEEIGTAKAKVLQIGKVETDRVEKGAQCGVAIEEEATPVEVGDVLAFIETKEE